jgi:hypothetical protein
VPTVTLITQVPLALFTSVYSRACETHIRVLTVITLITQVSIVLLISVHKRAWNIRALNKTAKSRMEPARLWTELHQLNTKLCSQSMSSEKTAAKYSGVCSTLLWKWYQPYVLTDSDKQCLCAQHIRNEARAQQVVTKVLSGGCSPSADISYSVKFIAKPPYNAEVLPSASPTLPARLAIDV